MSAEITFGLILFGCLMGAVALGIYLRRVLPAHYLSAAGAVRITWGATTYLSASVADWLASTTQERLEGTIVALNEDPQLTNPGGGVTFDNAALLETLDAYKLRGGSSMSNAGLDLNALFGTNMGSSDFYNGPVPRGLVFDIGAHEK